MARPGDRYRPSTRSYPERLVEVGSFYLQEDKLRVVRSKGEITFGNQTFAVGAAFIGETVALRESGEGRWDLYYCWKRLGVVDLNRTNKPKGYQNLLIQED